MRGRVKQLLGDEESALHDLTVAELLEHGSSVCDHQASLMIMLNYLSHSSLLSAF